MIVTLPDGRRCGWTFATRPMCPTGAHQLKTRTQVVTDAVVTCEHRAERQGAPCGVRVYVLKVTRAGTPVDAPSGDGLAWVCEVTGAQEQTLRSQRLGAIEVLDVLGGTVTGTLPAGWEHETEAA